MPSAEERVPFERVLPTLDAMLRVYNLAGRRDNKYKARIKILVGDLGIEGYREAVYADLAERSADVFALAAPEYDRIARHFAGLPEPLPPLRHPTTGAFGAWLAQNVTAHKVDGYAVVSISLKARGAIPGDATAEQMRVLADLAERYSRDELRVMHEQNIVLPHVALGDLHAVFRGLAGAGLDAPSRGLVTDIIACPGLDYCTLATARSIPVAQAISRRFADPERQVAIGPLAIKISGCINACGHHHVAHIGILGLDKAGVES